MIFKPKTLAKSILFVLCLFIANTSSAQKYKSNISTPVLGEEPTDARIEEGSKLFNTRCASCHRLDKDGTGPALGEVVSKYSGDYEYLAGWIKNWNKMVAAGDERAIAAQDLKGSVMNTFEDLEQEEVASILMWITNGGDGGVAEQAVVAPAAPVDESLYNKVNWGIVLLSLMIFVILILIVGILELVGNITGRQIINWNNVNAFMMLLFLALFFILVLYEYSIHKQFLLPEASSEHGLELDKMMKWTFIATLPVFFITQFLLFYFSFRYRQRPGKKAYYYPHNNNLEYVWTFIPAVVLTILVLGGLKSWKNIVKTDPPEDALHIEVFAEQFAWTARYPGQDGELGNHDFNLISATNSLGVANLEQAKTLIEELKVEIKGFEKNIEELGKREAELRSTLGGRVGADRKEHLRKINEYASGAKLNDLELLIRARNTQIERIERSIEAAEKSGFYNGKGDDDQLVREIHLVIDQPVNMKFRAKDVIHSAYLPYFRAQMNVVPGLPTQFTFTPTKTTNEMRRIKGDAEWDYYLVCNKICGNSHFNMKIKVVVEQQDEYDKWLEKQKALFAQEEPEQAEETTPVEDEETEEESTQQTEEELAIN